MVTDLLSEKIKDLMTCMFLNKSYNTKEALSTSDLRPSVSELSSDNRLFRGDIPQGRRKMKSYDASTEINMLIFMMSVKID